MRFYFYNFSISKRAYGVRPTNGPAPLDSHTDLIDTSCLHITSTNRNCQEIINRLCKQETSYETQARVICARLIKYDDTQPDNSPSLPFVYCLFISTVVYPPFCS